MRLRIDSWRWQGVPFYIRTGKCLPLTSTEVVVRLRRPPSVFPTAAPLSNYFRFRILPRQTIAFGVTVMDAADQMIGQRAELVASRQPGADERAAYERVLGDALEGDAALFARMDYVEEAWRIVDPVLAMSTPVREYEPGTWGPPIGPQDFVPPGGWANSTVEEGASSHDRRRAAEPTGIGDDARGPGRRRIGGALRGRGDRGRGAVRGEGSRPVRRRGQRRPNGVADAARAERRWTCRG